MQLWVAQPSATCDGAAAFEHHPELPRVDLDDGVATVLVGDLGDAASPARRDTDHVAVDLVLRRGQTVVPLVASSEYAAVMLAGRVELGGAVVTPGHLAYLGTGRQECTIQAREPARALIIGGPPFPETLVMWWNFVARTRDEITAAHREWAQHSERFGRVASTLPRLEVDPPPWATAA